MKATDVSSPKEEDVITALESLSGLMPKSKSPRPTSVPFGKNFDTKVDSKNMPPMIKRGQIIVFVTIAGLDDHKSGKSPV